MKQKFQFGGIGALFGHEIDLLVTPDPLHKPGLMFEPVFDYEQVLVVGTSHPLAQQPRVKPAQLTGEVLLTYPVGTERLDIYSSFLTPAGISPRKHKTIETTDIMLQMVASGRGVSALPRWLVEGRASKFEVLPVKLRQKGVAKQIFVSYRKADVATDYLQGFVDLARKHQTQRSCHRLGYWLQRPVSDRSRLATLLTRH